MEKKCFRGAEEFGRNKKYLTGNEFKLIDREFHPYFQPGSKIMIYPFTEMGENSDFCRSLVRPELSYAQRLRAKQGLPIDGSVIMDGFKNIKRDERYKTADKIRNLMKLPDLYKITFSQ